MPERSNPGAAPLSPRVSLALVIHNHQPVGNFGWVIARNNELAYEPMVAALERHPAIRVALHYTGPLLQWLRAERPEFLARLRALVDHGQVEILGGGFYEPVLASLPEADRVGQLRRTVDELTTEFGRRPRGAWLAERVWEPDVPTSLAAAGYEWTILDDAHFRAASVPEDALWGAYTTDDQGRRISVFASEQGLRYRIPYGDVGDVIRYLRDHATDDGSRLGVMGDDGEKFGAWPGTWEHCWGAGAWVDRFFDALEGNVAWLSTTTPSAWLDRQPPVGRVYVPTGSYAEMGEWALPADEGHLFGELFHTAVVEKRPEARWLRGGFWRNFQVKYREVNDLHKQMLRASAKVAAMEPGSPRARALDHLHQGQSNDCYWHGIFGGIYISHMRLATYAHLIAAEDAADRAARVAGILVDGAVLRDVDLDGVDEILASSPGQVLTLKPAEGGGIGSWDIRAARHALTAVLRRRPEAYHGRLVDLDSAGESGEPGTTASIHELARTREPGMSRRLCYDRYERRSGLVHLVAPGTTLEQFADASFTEKGDFVDRPYRVESLTGSEAILVRDGQVQTPTGPIPVQVTKVVRFDGERRRPELGLEVTVANCGGGEVEALLVVEWATTLLGGGGNPAAYYLVDGTRIPHDSTGRHAALAEITAGNDDLGLRATTSVTPAAEAWWYSIDTVSLSEGGFERSHQGSCLAFVWPLRLTPGERRTVAMSSVVSVDRDLAEEEGL